MKSTILDLMQKNSLRLAFCTLVLGASTATFAQDDLDDVDAKTALKAPARKVVEDKTPTVEIKGVITDVATGNPISGVHVQMLGNKRYTAMSNAKGEFTLKVPTFATALYVTAPRYSNQQVAIYTNEPNQQVKITMLSDRFGAMYDESTNVSAQKTFTAAGNGTVIDDEIQQNLGADVRTVLRSGVIDGGGSMFIRGLNSLNANSQPLILVDGVEIDMMRDRSSLHDGQFFNILSNFSPEDIEKVTVLKNATALYGARGANGVILIETKRGHSMATRIDANISVGVTMKPQLPTMMNGQQYRSYATEILGTVDAMKLNENRGLAFNFMNDDPSGYYYNTYHNDTDWQDYVYREALTQNYNINVQGGDDVGMYNLSVGYMMADSPVKSSDFDRLNVRFNTDISILWNLKTKFDMSFSRVNNNVFDDGIQSDLTTSTITSPTFLALIKSPLVAPYQYNKHIGGFTSLLSDYDTMFGPLAQATYGSKNDYAYSLANPVAILENGEGDNKNRLENTFFNVRIAPTYQINDHLSATTDFSYYLNRNSQRYYRPNEGVPPFQVDELGKVYSMTASLFAKETNALSNTHIDWNNQYGRHTIAATAGFRYSYFSYDGSDLSTEFRTETNDKNPYLTSDIKTGYQGVEGANDVWKSMQWYVNADYNYMNRYFVNVSAVAEANSRFGSKASGGINAFGTRWAVFPSLQAGWVITNENWFPKHVGIDYLRLHAGVDMSGNDNISNYAAQTSFSSVRYNYNMIGMQLTNIGNDEIKWETTTKYNVGLQANLLHNRVAVGFDYYFNKTKDLLTIQTFNNPVAGINNYWTNGGSLQNTGFEVSISGKPVATKDWTFEVGASVGHYKNKVTELPDGTYTTSAYGDDNIITQVGSPLAMFYGYQTNGVFADDAAARAAAKTAGKDDYLYMTDNAGNRQYFTSGNVYFVDQNNDGEINEKDKVVIGDPNPDIYGNIFAAVTWKNFTLNANFNYSLGNDVYNYQRSVLNSGSTFYNQQIEEIAHWSYEGQVTNLPKLAYGDPLGNNRFSDRWIEDGSYLRLKSVKLTYQIPIPEAWTSWLQGISVWGEARNVFTLTHYTGSDPEFSISNSVYYQGIDCGNLAQCRSFLCGVKINL